MVIIPARYLVINRSVVDHVYIRDCALLPSNGTGPPVDKEVRLQN